MRPNEVFDAEGQSIGTYQHSILSKEGKMMLIARDEQFGGGTIVLSAHEAGEPEIPWHLPYGEISIREAPPYSPNVPVHAYFRFRERLGADNSNISMGSYLPSGSGTLQTNGGVPDDLLRSAINEALDEDDRINHHLIDMSVHEGTVLLEGFQNDTQERLLAAQAVASVPGVREIVNMLVIRPL
jgi:hypothetical protein